MGFWVSMIAHAYVLVDVRTSKPSPKLRSSSSLPARGGPVEVQPDLLCGRPADILGTRLNAFGPLVRFGTSVGLRVPAAARAHALVV
jgi:hypothetical protein